WRHKLGLDARQVSKEDFRRNLSNITNRLKNQNINHFYLTIPSFPSDIEEKYFPLINNDIRIYNEIMRNFPSRTFLPEESYSESLWQPETVHFNQKGHQKAAEVIENIIRNQLSLDNY
ncbi:MAG: hypothetical protein ABEK50_07150, partial [bacterium]